MDNIVVYSNLAPTQDLSLNLFEDFLRFIDRCERTTQTYITNLRQFAAWLKYKTISRPIRQDIIDYREYLLQEHEAIQLDPVNGWCFRLNSAGHKIILKCKANTVKQYLQCVKQFFKWTASEGLYPNIAENVHAPKVRNDTHRKEAFTPREVLTIEESIKEGAERRTQALSGAQKDKIGRIERATEQGKRLYAMYLLAVNCGLRTIEISRANIEDISTKDGKSYLYIWGKGHTEADTKKALAPEVKAAIDDYLNARTDKKSGNSPLFVSTGNRSGGKRINPTTISKFLKKAMQAAGYNDARLTAHSLRHSTGTCIQQLTGDLYKTQMYMRHANPKTTEIYIHTETDEQDAELAQQLYNLYHSN